MAKQGFQAALAHQSTIFGLPHHFEKHPTMRNYLFSLIVCYTLIAPAFAKQPHYVEGKLVNYANHVYPRQAMENEEEGTVKLRIFVAPDNSVEQVEIVESSGSTFLDESAKKAAYKSTFQAALRNGKPVHTVFTTRFTFQMHSDDEKPFSKILRQVFGG